MPRFGDISGTNSRKSTISRAAACDWRMSFQREGNAHLPLTAPACGSIRQFAEQAFD
jgi:hypothetical protein